jgi:hypothetical protein
MTQILILLTGLLSMSWSASSRLPEPPVITDFKFELQYNTGKIPQSIIADIYGDSLIVGIIPYQQSEFNLVATFTTTAGATVQVNGADQQSAVTINNFASPVTYVVSSTDGVTSYNVKLIYTGLPLVYVNTDGGAPILDKDDYVDGTITIYPNVDTMDVATGAMGIRGRGNTTWTLPKKPYKVKMESGTSFLGMPSDKEWVLLANYSDKTLMRNSMAYYLGDHLSFPYTPRTTPVDLVLNGVYQGSYVFGEHQKADKDRVKIEELGPDDTDPAVITGGYFLELDDYRDGLYFELTSGLPFVIKSPDEDDITQAQFDYIKGYMQKTEEVIFSEYFSHPDSGYAKYINPETFIDWYWVSELMKNIDARDVSSIFYYKDRDEKLNMGPLWDFDVAAGNATQNTGEDPTEFYVRESKWFKRLFEDSVFKSQADARWRKLRDGLFSTLPQWIDSVANRLDESQRLNFYKWDILNQPIWPSTLVFGTYENEVNYLKSWLLQRIAWIDAQIPVIPDPEPEPEPEPALVPFNLVTPLDGMRVSVTPDDSGTMTFSWNPSTSGASYQLLIDTVGYPASPDTTSAIAISELYRLFDLATDTDSATVRWTVRAMLNDTSATAQDTFLIKLVNGVLGVPQQGSPDASANVETLTPTLTWSNAYLAQGYDVQVSGDETFETPVVNISAQPDTSLTITDPLAEETRYYWRIRAMRPGKVGEWSEVRFFTTPVVTAVADNGYGVALFPNPTSHELFIEVPLFTPLENAELVDALGRRVVSSQLLAGSTTRIDVSSLKRGMYVLILRGGANKPVMSKIVLR